MTEGIIIAAKMAEKNSNIKIITPNGGPFGSRPSMRIIKPIIKIM